MAMVKKSITVTNQQNDWIKAKIVNGNYGVFRALIRKEQNMDAEIEIIRAALIKGEQSGISMHTPEQIRQNVQERMRKNGNL